MTYSSAPCVLHVMTLYDLFQLLGGFSFLFYAAFVRSQYLRVEQVCIIVCVTTVTMPVHLHGTNFVPFLLLTRRCYDAETSAILLLLKRAFA